ncbi:hypothetical protein Enr13x_36630 [Stieleria neptunia]|uniref:Uncharacterized protein n=1 Tax=Stieleria neptunia TaxID=2527979 RepID=A0A518HSG8_9BACT|nr:hypothetical protein [Stieleria neptunia]QDV43803.1 hypothetical protein Enr13x_36630 [Stieleria neptunia]
MPQTEVVEGSLIEVVKSLKQEKQRLSSELEAVQATAREKENGLKRVNAALAALEGTPTGKGKKRRSNGKPSATKEQVKSIVNDLVAGGMTIEAEQELRQAVEKQLVEQGYSLSGVALRFRGVLQAFQTRQRTDSTSSSTESI